MGSAMDSVLEGLRAVLERDLVNPDPATMPLLAHYTSLCAFEQIAKNDQLWFSHPSFMNDHAEVVSGIEEAQARIRYHGELPRAFSSSDDYIAFLDGFEHGLSDFGFLDIADTYIFSFSEHDRKDFNGRLSMWRGYGAEGHGVAMVIDPSKLTTTQFSPLIFDKVHYLDEADRIAWIEDLFDRTAAYLQQNPLQPTQCHDAGRLLFLRVKLASIFSKHVGFKEEVEWRVVYMPDRDVKGLLADQLSYFNGPRGLEPKLKLRLHAQPDVTGDPALETLVERLILGPSRASPILKMTAQRLLTECGKKALVSKVHVSDIPFRTLR